MEEAVHTTPAEGEADSDSGSEDYGHPRGTLAIVLLYGLLFGLVWLGIYLFEFMPRGAPTP